MTASSSRPAIGNTTASPAAARSVRKFLRFFPAGFRDEKYLAWERNYKWQAHLRWMDELAKPVFAALLKHGEFAEAAARAVRIESRTNLLFSFEKMALRDAVRSTAGARRFAEGLFAFLHGPGQIHARFTRWVEVVDGLPRRQTRVLTWPLVSVFGFLAHPQTHCFLKPTVTRAAARVYGWEFRYRSRPNWDTYAELLEFVRKLRRDLRELRPRDMIDLQSFIWVQGSDEYL